MAVLHFAIDADKPGENVEAFWWQMATGSMPPAGSSLSRGMAGKR